MSAKNAVLLAGLAAVAVIVWLIVRPGADAPAADRGSPSQATGGSNAGDTSGTAGGADRVHGVRPPIRIGSSGMDPDLEGPALPPTDPSATAIDAAPPPSLDDEFVAEKRDAAWAGEHEREIKKRLAAVASDGIAVESTECRAHQCRITFKAADETAIGRYVARLEEDGGLYGYARLLVLDPVITLPDGQRRARVFARFE